MSDAKLASAAAGQTVQPGGEGSRLPEFISDLGLALPISEADVHEAYRARAKQAHPDAGGDQQRFIALQQAYEHALEYARFHGGRAQWLAASIDRYMEHQEFLEHIQSLGGTAAVESIDWLQREIGQDFAQMLDKVVGLKMRGPNFNDDALEYMLMHRNALAALAWVDLSESRVTDIGLKRLEFFPTLRTLLLRDTGVSERGLHVIGLLPELERLDLTGVKLGWLALRKLRRQWPELEIVRE